jgi:hypothetical protein
MDGAGEEWAERASWRSGERLRMSWGRGSYARSFVSWFGVLSLRVGYSRASYSQVLFYAK